MNLYLYIPPKSAHPPSCFKGLIHGKLQRYWNQNNPTDFQNIATNFIQRLVERGHTIEDITPLLLQAAFQLNPTTTIKSSQNNSEEDTLYIHWEHHPHGIQRRDLRQIYNKTLSKVSPFKKMTVALSRPTNLRDLLVRAALNTTHDTYIQDIINRLRQPRSLSEINQSDIETSIK